MPEMRFSLRWPDGTRSLCYSPSLVVQEHLAEGADYPVAEFLSRACAALSAASERVRQIHGFPCSRALAQAGELRRLAALHAGQDQARVRVLAFHREPQPPGGAS